MPVPAHLGGLHPAEQLTVLIIAFGPFVVLVVVVLVLRRKDAAAERAESNDPASEDPRGEDAP